MDYEWLTLHRGSFAALFVLILALPLMAADLSSLRGLFREPTRDDSSGPLWVWNDTMTDELVLATLRDLHAQHIRQVWVHPRPGLMTPYLSDEWFRLWGVALDEARKLDMNVWIYDENSYPSGFAGGYVPELMPESRGRGLALRESPEPPAWSDDLVAVYSLAADACKNVSAAVRGGEKLPGGRYVTAAIVRAQPQPWHGGRTYVDLMYPGVTEKFLEVTLEPYRKHFGGEFGKRIPGTFTDEPELRPAGGLPWTPDLPEVFRKLWGYDLLDHLPALEWEVGDWRMVRHNYLSTLNELFTSRWGKPYHDYCEKHGLQFTGHYWEHEWPMCLRVPDNMAMYSFHQTPAIDTLFNQYQENTHAQFGNVRAVRELASIANQMGRQRTLCEAYGASGWECRLEDTKRIGDWLYVLGVNTLNQHLSYASIRGARKYDHPPSFSIHAPWWEAYHEQADYFARLSAALSAGEQINEILVLEPTSTAWMYQASDRYDPQMGEVGKSFFDLLMTFERAQVEYDIGSEYVLARHGRVDGTRLVVGERSYPLVVLPPRCENLNARTVELLAAYLQAGGQVIALDEPPARVDGASSGRVAELAGQAGWRRADDPAGLAVELAGLTDGVRFERAADDAGILFHLRRRVGEDQILFLVNTSDTHPTRGRFTARAVAVERWDPFTGATEAYSFVPHDDGVAAEFDLPPCGSLLLALTQRPGQSAPPRRSDGPADRIAPAGEPVIERLDPNVLTLDYMDVKVGGQSRAGLYMAAAADFVYQQFGFERDPWDRAVQFEDELIRRRFPADSSVELSYRFTVRDRVPAAIEFVAELADRYTITCNGEPVSVEPGQFWLDRAMGRVNLAGNVKLGENVVTLKASPFTMHHEPASAFVIGDFGVLPADKGFAIAGPAPLTHGPWKEQAMPLYGGKVAYRQVFELNAPSGEYRVVLEDWLGSLARVDVNGERAGYIYLPPYRCEVGRLLKPGRNEIVVTVFGTLKNPLGPHHNGPGLGLVGPGNFLNAPADNQPAGANYATLGYGLSKPFRLERTR